MNPLADQSLLEFSSRDLEISKTPFFIHKDAKEILTKARDISEKLDIVEDLYYSDHTTMTNYIYTSGPISKMVHAVVLYDVLYYFDDFFGEDTLQGEKIDLKMILDVWEGRFLDLSPFNKKISNLFRALSYISTCIREDSSSLFFEKYTKAVKEHLWFAVKSPEFTTVQEYLDIRLHTGGMLPVIDLMEYIDGCHIQSNLYEEIAELEKVRITVAMIGALSNDLFSYAKEKHSDFNLINAYLNTAEALSFEEAILKALKLVNKLYKEYLDLEAEIRLALLKLSNHEAEIVKKYLNGLEVIISACYLWQFATNRYVHSENIFSDMRG